MPAVESEIDLRNRK